MVSGSTGTEHSDEKENSADDGDAGKSADGYTEGIPGPVTRLFVLANRGLANLVQDLILVRVQFLFSYMKWSHGKIKIICGSLPSNKNIGMIRDEVSVTNSMLRLWTKYFPVTLHLH